jgi:hypothetical protein
MPVISLALTSHSDGPIENLVENRRTNKVALADKYCQYDSAITGWCVAKVSKKVSGLTKLFDLVSAPPRQ